jgi:hypothetical protein
MPIVLRRRGFFLILLGIVCASCATAPPTPADPAAFTGVWSGEWFSSTGPGRGTLTVEIGPPRSDLFSLHAVFTNAPFPSLSGDAKLVGNRLELSRGELVVQLTQRSRDRLEADWSFGRSRGGWSLTRTK